MFYITQQVIYQCGVEPLARDTPTSTPPEQDDATKHGNAKSEILEEHSRMDISEEKGTGTLRESGTSMTQLVRTHRLVWVHHPKQSQQSCSPDSTPITSINKVRTSLPHSPMLR